MVTKGSKTTQVSKATSIELLLTSPLTEVCELYVDKKLFKKLSKTGVTEDELDEIKSELESSTEFYSLVFKESYPRISLEIDGELNESFEKHFDELYKTASQQKNTDKNSILKSSESTTENKNNPELRYALLWDRYYKRSFWKLTISEIFDPSKFSIELNSQTMIGGNEYTGFIPYYDGKEFEFSSDHGFDVDEIMLIDSKDKRYEIEIADED